MYIFCVGHHPYVNIRGKDPDLTYENEIYRYASWHPYCWAHRFQMFTFWIIWCFAVTHQSFVVDFKFVQSSNYQGVVPALAFPVCEIYYYYFFSLIIIIIIYPITMH